MFLSCARPEIVSRPHLWPEIFPRPTPFPATRHLYKQALPVAMEAALAALPAMCNDATMVSLEAVAKEAAKVSMHELRDDVVTREAEAKVQMYIDDAATEESRIAAVAVVARRRQRDEGGERRRGRGGGGGGRMRRRAACCRLMRGE
jgi:hypothetical protein